MISTLRNVLLLKSGILWESFHWPHIFWLNIFGWWSEEANSPFMRSVLSKIRSVVLVHALIFSAAMVIAIFEKFSKGDIMTNMFTVFASGIATTGMFKMVQVIYHRKLLKSTMDSLDELQAEANSPVAQVILRRGFRRCWVVFIISLVSGSCITLHWLIRPLLLAFIHQERSRIVDTWPEMNDTWFQFAMSYAFQSPGVSSIGHSFYLYDNLFFCLSESILTHFEILNHRLQSLRFNNELGKSKELIDCVKYHKKLLSTCSMLRDASKSSIIFQCINTVVMSCSGVFVLTMNNGLNANVLMNSVEILLIITVVLYSYCWYSNEMTFQCEHVMRAAYMSNWVDTNQKNKTTLHILMNRSTKSVYFGGILRINLSTFISVLKAIFSYYNFLLAVSGK